MTEHDSLIQRADDLLACFPKEPLSDSSKSFLKDDALGWYISRKRILTSALSTGDQVLTDAMVDEIAHVVGIKRAQLLKLNIWGKIVENNLDSDALILS